MTGEVLAPPLEAYLRRLSACLSSLDADERKEIVAEVRAHFVDRQGQGRADVLAEFEPPEAYASRFLEQTALARAVAGGTTIDLGRALLSGVKRGAENVLVVLPLLLLQLSALVLVLLGALKPFFFRNVGVFPTDGPPEIGFIADGPGRGPDLLGWWTIPAFVVPGILAFWVCNRVLRALAARRLKSASRAHPAA